MVAMPFSIVPVLSNSEVMERRIQPGHLVQPAGQAIGRGDSARA
jgi:hypothetical protein